MQTVRLSRCQACQVMFYCDRDHQVSHRAEHKKTCNAVKKAKQHLDTEEQSLRNQPPDMFLPANVDALTKIKTKAAVQVAYDHTRDLLQLCHGDNIDVRDLIPSLLLRLGRDQDCYDFVKWYAEDQPTYDWGVMSLQFLDVKDADVFEDVDIFTGEYFATCHTVAIMLVKIRLLMELRTLRDSKMIGEKVPKEILGNVRDERLSHAHRIHHSKRKILDSEDEREGCIEQLKYQIVQLHEAIQGANQYFWPALLKPRKHLSAPISPYSAGSVTEMQLYLQYSYHAWAETPGGIDIVKLLEENEFMDQDDDVYEADEEVNDVQA